MNREAFLAACEQATGNLKRHRLEIEPFGVVYFQELDDQQRVERWDNWIAPNGKPDKSRIAVSRVYTIVATVCDESGNQLLKAADIPMLQKLPAAAVSKMAEVAMACCGLSDEDIESKLKKKSDNSGETTDDIAN